MAYRRLKDAGGSAGSGAYATGVTAEFHRGFSMIDTTRAGVMRVSSVSLKLDPDAVWTYAANHREVIGAHWNMAVSSNPAFFNGIVHVLKSLAFEGGHVAGTVMPTEFKNFLYWRDEGFPAEARVLDVFGSALIRSREGHIILGRQRPGNINEGQAYLPGGFIDPRDVTAHDTIDIRASVAREVAEETGLDDGALTPAPGFIVTFAPPHVSFAVPYTSHLSSAELVARIRTNIGAQADPELAEPVVLTKPSDMDGRAVAHYARILLSSPVPWEL